MCLNDEIVCSGFGEQEPWPSCDGEDGLIDDTGQVHWLNSSSGGLPAGCEK